MNMIDKSLSDITLGNLLDRLAERPHLPLVFSYDGQDIRPGYHVTEVKAGAFAALDCGANHETWSEIFVQLWDIDEADRTTHMTAAKFSAIVRKVSEHLQLDGTAKLTFEVSDGVRPMQLYCANATEDGDVLRVVLSPRPASCKPRDRWLAENPVSPGCCAPSSNATCCA